MANPAIQLDTAFVRELHAAGENRSAIAKACRVSRNTYYAAAARDKWLGKAGGFKESDFKTRLPVWTDEELAALTWDEEAPAELPQDSEILGAEFEAFMSEPAELDRI